MILLAYINQLPGFSYHVHHNSTSLNARVFKPILFKLTTAMPQPSSYHGFALVQDRLRPQKPDVLGSYLGNYTTGINKMHGRHALGACSSSEGSRGYRSPGERLSYSFFMECLWSDCSVDGHFTKQYFNGAAAAPPERSTAKIQESSNPSW